MRVYLGNRQISLFERLKENLFFGTYPFSKRFLIVPSPEMGEWVRLQLAKDETFHIAAGITLLTLNQALALFSTPFPTRLQVALLVRHEVKRILDEESDHPLARYLEGHPARLMPLCKELSRLFLKYGVYGHSHHGVSGSRSGTAAHLLDKKGWLSGSQEHWQITLFNRLFSEETFSLSVKETLPEGRVHLFSFSHLAPRFFHFFERLDRSLPVAFYHLSPCQEFWSDGLADKVAFQEQHPLLANLGRVGRSFAALVEESCAETHEVYEPPSGESQLARLQRRLLSLDTAETLATDGSIQLHQVPSAHREIQVLYETLRGRLGAGDISPADVLVMAPDIAPYEPFIHAYFGKDIDYRIADLAAAVKNTHILGLLQLLDLEAKRWSAPALLALFDHPLFGKRWRFSREDVLAIRTWAQESHVCWGKDPEHVATLLKGSAHLHQNSWREGIDRLLHRLGSDVYGPPIDLTEATRLLNLAEVVEKLSVDLAPFSGKEERTLGQWASLLETLSHTYFAGEEEQRGSLIGALGELAHLCPQGHTYPFSTCRFFLEEILQGFSVTLRKNHIGGVHFSSMLPMRAIPAKVIWLLGMNHDHFPRKEMSGCPDLLQGKGAGDYCPTRRDFDRYLFLEALLSARNTFVMSYNEEPPSPVVLELLSAVKEVQRHEHTLHAFDASNFQQEGRTQVSSESDYRCALALKGEKKEPASLFGAPKEMPLPKGETVLDLADLIRLARSPLKHYFLRVFGLSFYKEEDVEDQEPFTLSPLQAAILRRARAEKPLAQVVEEAKRRGTFPVGVFGQVALQKLADEEVEPILQRSCSLEPLLLEAGAGSHFALFGHIGGVTEKGLLVHEKSDLRGCARVWPLFLAATCHLGPLPLIFAKDGVIKGPLKVDPRPQLSLFAEYSLTAASTASPLFPEWIDSFLKGDADQLSKEMAKSLSGSYGRTYDEALLFATRAQPLPRADALLADWGDYATHLYGGMKDALF